MNDRLTILQGDALEQLRTLPDESVQMCVTSPPYWGLRDYGTATWDGGSDECDHLMPPLGGTNSSGLANYANGLNAETIAAKVNEHRRQQYREECGKCGAQRVDHQIGLERTPQQFVAKLVEVFEEVRRVLKPDGTCWVNLGDSYASASSGAGQSGMKALSDKYSPRKRPRENHAYQDESPYIARATPVGLKPKDLCGIPWRVAFALQEAGWYLRSDIIWSKPNPMPESVTDRPTKAHEYLFLLTKAERYYYDAEAIKEQVTGNANPRGNGVNKKIKMPDGWDTGPGGHGSFHRNGRENGATRPKQNASWSAAVTETVETRNKRSVWTVPTYAFPEAHFATYPPDLIKPCILAGSKPGDVVLDPFGGSGTTGAVAIELGRKAVLIELNPEYVALIEKRCGAVTPGLALFSEPTLEPLATGDPQPQEETPDLFQENDGRAA